MLDFYLSILSYFYCLSVILNFIGLLYIFAIAFNKGDVRYGVFFKGLFYCLVPFLIINLFINAYQGDDER